LKTVNVLTMMVQKEKENRKDWFDLGYKNGNKFVQHEADYDELAGVYRARGIPMNWDIFRAEILNKHIGDKNFDFQAYIDGFARACIEFFEKL
jgi:hypothetical protein